MDNARKDLLKAKNEIEFNEACNQAIGALWNFQAWLEKEHSLTGIEAAKVALEVIEALPQTFTPHGLQAYIDCVKNRETNEGIAPFPTYGEANPDEH